MSTPTMSPAIDGSINKINAFNEKEENVIKKTYFYFCFVVCVC
jgi:hypothetical protein